MSTPTHWPFIESITTMQGWRAGMAALIKVTEAACDACPFDQHTYDQACEAMRILRAHRATVEAIEARSKTRPSPSFADTAIAPESPAPAPIPPKPTTGKTDPFRNAL